MRKDNEREMGYGTGLGAATIGKKEDVKGRQTGFDKSVGNNTRHPVRVEAWPRSDGGRCEGPAVAWQTAWAFFYACSFSSTSSSRYEGCIYGAISGVSAPTSKL